jgi:hypothetical protein
MNLKGWLRLWGTTPESAWTESEINHARSLHSPSTGRNLNPGPPTMQQACHPHHRGNSGSLNTSDASKLLNNHLQAPQAFWRCSILCNPNIHLRVHKSRPIIPIPNQKNEFHAAPSCFLNIYFKMTLPYTPKSLCISPLPPACYMPRLSPIIISVLQLITEPVVHHCLSQVLVTVSVSLLPALWNTEEPEAVIRLWNHPRSSNHYPSIIFLSAKATNSCTDFPFDSPVHSWIPASSETSLVCPMGTLAGSRIRGSLSCARYFSICNWRVSISATSDMSLLSLLQIVPNNVTKVLAQ